MTSDPDLEIKNLSCLRYHVAFPNRVSCFREFDPVSQRLPLSFL